MVFNFLVLDLANTDLHRIILDWYVKVCNIGQTPWNPTLFGGYRAGQCAKVDFVTFGEPYALEIVVLLNVSMFFSKLLLFCNDKVESINSFVFFGFMWIGILLNNLVCDKEVEFKI